VLPSMVEAEKFSDHPCTLWLRVFILAIINTGEAEALYATLKFLFSFWNVMYYFGKVETDSAILNFGSRLCNFSLNISPITNKGRIRPYSISEWRLSQSDTFCVLKMIRKVPEEVSTESG
jgi:hypothetical protein